jgi:hypothetical protein
MIIKVLLLLLCHSRCRRPPKDQFPPRYHQVLLLADAIWKKQHPQTLYGGSWKCPLPSSYAEQEFSRTTCFANGSYGLDAIQQMNRQPIINEPSRTSETNTSDPTPYVTPMDNSESRLTDVSHLLFDNGQTTFSPDSLVGR